MKIGIFDSGVGGLTVVNALKDFDVEIIYFGDIGRSPYGTKSKQIIKKFARQISNFLSYKLGCDMLIAACNTVSAVALESLRNKLTIPIFGVIEPGVRLALEITKNYKIGIIGTTATIRSQIYQQLLKKYNPNVSTFAKACPLFVPLVEEGLIDSQITYLTAQYYLKDFQSTGIDTLILGCTHYPLLKNVIKKVLAINLVDSAEALRITLKKKFNWREKKFFSLHCYTTDEPAMFKSVAQKFLDIKIDNVEYLDLSYLEQF